MTATLAGIRRRVASLSNPRNAAALRRFVEEEAHRVELSTIASRLDAIMALGRRLGRRSWKSAVRDDIIGTIAEHESLRGAHLKTKVAKGQPLADSTKYQWSIFLLIFYKWLLDTDEKPKQFRRLPFRKVDAMARRIKVLCLKPAEVRKLLAGAVSKRDRAIIVVALEAGFRASELAALRLDGLEQRNHGYWMVLDEAEPNLKTGARDVPVPIIAGKATLAEWLAEHPRRHEAKPPLFVTQSNRSYGKRMTGAGISEAISRCAKRAKLRRVHAHMLRHTSTSFRVVRNVNPEVIRLTNGWSKSGNMLQYYTHAEPYFEAMALEAHGIKVDSGTDILDILGSQACLLCGTKVPVDAPRCEACGVPNADAITRAHATRNRTAALEFVGPELAKAMGWAGAAEAGPVQPFLEAHFRKVDPAGDEERFVRWCLKRWGEVVV